MIDFAADTAAIFADGLAEDAVYQPKGGVSSVELRVIPRRPDVVSDLGSSSVLSSSFSVLVETAVVTPEPGDFFTLGGEVYTVLREPVRDERRLFWRVELTPCA